MKIIKKKNGKKMKTLNGTNGSFIKYHMHLNGNSGNELTERELQILQYFAYGITTPELSKEIFVSTHTIETHRKNIIRKMGARNLSHAIAEGIRKKLIR
jgi:DNA-binding CsgD family transcriptional regulator